MGRAGAPVAHPAGTTGLDSEWRDKSDASTAAASPCDQRAAGRAQEVRASALREALQRLNELQMTRKEIDERQQSQSS